MNKERIEDFRKELKALVNRYSLEGFGDGNVPDYILADVMVNALISFNLHHKDVCRWYGVKLEPGNKYIPGTENIPGHFIRVDDE
jgi:hypothetical protein